MHCCLLRHRPHRLPLFTVTRLNRFTLTHCGSHAPLTTLKPNLAASAPSLGTNCLLGFIGCGLPPHYIASAFWRTYEAVRLLTCRLLPSAISPARVAYRFRSLSDLPGTLELPCTLATLFDHGGTCASLSLVCALLPAATVNASASASSGLRGSITSRFRIAALALLYLRLNLASRLRLQD